MKKLLATVTVALGLSAGGVIAQECGDITMAEFNWASGELLANVDKIILEEGYGCNVELIVGGTSAIFASMDSKGVPDIAGEQWVNGVRELVDTAIAEGRLHSVNLGPITGLGEGWWVPPYTAEANPELKTVLDWIERPDLFPSQEDPSKGAFVGCPAGWGCQHVNNNLFEAYDMAEKGWVLIDPGSAAGLDASIAKANERGENWLGYYWSPTSIIGKYNMQAVPFGVEFAGAEHWNTCISQEGCADPQKTSWVKSEVFTIVTDDFMKNGGEINDYLAARVYPGDVMGTMLVYMADEQADGEDAAFEFLIQYEDLWTTWVSEEVAAKVKAAL
ncbi:MAG: ABC transporter substrate-binding protein [Rhodobacteraceae bacterium]|nr:MAG: ABC transporter substrate-binding protein [Paracoccaceae bacterium]